MISVANDANLNFIDLWDDVASLVIFFIMSIANIAIFRLK